MVQIEYLPIVLTGIGIIVSILYYTSVLRNTNKTRQTQIFMQIFHELNTDKRWKEYLESVYETEWQDYHDFQKKFGRGNLDFYSKLSSLFWTYNAIGTLIEDNLIDPKRVYKLMGPMVISQWEKWGPIIHELRVDINQPEAYGAFQSLYWQMVTLREEGFVNELVKTQIEAYKF